MGWAGRLLYTVYCKLDYDAANCLYIGKPFLKDFLKSTI